MRRWVLVLFLAGCAVADGPTGGSRGTGNDGMGGVGGGAPLPDLGTARDFSHASDLAHGPSGSDLAEAHDLAHAADLASAPDLSQPSGSSCVPRINEVMTGEPSAATDEFVELYNPCSTAIDLSSWKLVYRAGTNVNPVSGSDSSTLFAFGAGAQIGELKFLVYAGAGFSGSKDGALASSLKDGDGSVGLRDATGALRDSVAYGSVTAGNAFVRGSAAPAPAVVAGGGSIGRVPDGADTGNNSVDFHALSAISPGSANP
jgi:hypothetical protein